MDAVDQIVGVHHRVNVGLGDGGFERGQIDLAHGAIVDIDVGVVPVELLIVEREMLDGGGDALRLHAFNVGDHEGGIQKRIFRKVFEVTPAEGRTRDVDAGPEQEVDATGAGIAAQAFADFARKLGIPTRCQRGAACIGRGRSPGAHADRGIGHLEPRQLNGRHGTREHAVDAAKQLDLLLQREFRDHRVGLRFDGGRIGRRSLSRNSEAGRKENGGSERQKREKRVQPMRFHDAPTLAHWAGECTERTPDGRTDHGGSPAKSGICIVTRITGRGEWGHCPSLPAKRTLRVQ